MFYYTFVLSIAPLHSDTLSVNNYYKMIRSTTRVTLYFCNYYKTLNVEQNASS